MGRVRDWSCCGPPRSSASSRSRARTWLYNTIIPSFWQETYGTPWYGTPQLADRVWVANRCQQLNAQQIASMPLVFHGPPVEDTEPAWVSSPDPNWYPNGIGDALHAIVDQLYGWGFSCQYVTDLYADGFPRTWTVLPSAAVQIKLEDGRREYKLGEDDPRSGAGGADRPQPDDRACTARRRCGPTRSRRGGCWRRGTSR